MKTVKTEFCTVKRCEFVVLQVNLILALNDQRSYWKFNVFHVMLVFETVMCSAFIILVTGNTTIIIVLYSFLFCVATKRFRAAVCCMFKMCMKHCLLQYSFWCH